MSGAPAPLVMTVRPVRTVRRVVNGAPAPLVMTVRPVRTVRPVESGHPAPHVTTGPSEAIGPHVPLARHGRATSLVGTAPTRQRVARGVPAAQ